MRNLELKTNINNSSAQSLFEVVFTLAVAAIVLTGIVSLAATAVRNSIFARNNALATRYAQETSEWLRQLRDSSSAWATFSGKASGFPGTSYCLQSLGAVLPPSGNCASTAYISDTRFIREATLILRTTDSLDDTVEAIIAVKWPDAQGLHEVKTTTQYTRWQTP